MKKIKAQRWVALIAVITLLFALVQIVGIVRRNAQYDHILKTYSEVLKPGMKRSEVEAYLITSKRVSFSQDCCIGSKALRDLVEIAREQKGWVCPEEVVNVAFQFAATDPKRAGYADPEDRLIGTSLDRSGCLLVP
jgi:hypothetical protein